jgi:serralysin
MGHHSMDDFVGVDKAGGLVSAPLQDPFNSPLNLTGIDLTTADGISDVTLAGSLDGSVSVGEVFAVSLTAGVTYSFAERPTATGGIEDSYLRLYNPTGTQITFDDDGGAGRSSLLSFTPTTDGTYFLAAGSWVNEFAGGGDVGNFTLDQWSSNGPDAPATMAGAVTIGEGVTFGQLTSASDVDMYQIDLSSGLYYTFNYSGGNDGAGETGNIAEIDLLDSAGNVVASDLNYESGMSFLADHDGTYYVQVTPYTAIGTAHGGYTLDVAGIDLSTKDPLDSIRWKSANNIQTHDVHGVATATVYFGQAGESFGQFEDNGVTPMITYGWTTAQHDALLNMLSTTYTPITGINYVETTDSSTATFRVLTDHSTVYGAYFDPQDPAYGPDQGIGVFNLLSGGFTLDSSLQQGGYSYAVMAHEFGHAHGLAHPHDTGGGSDIMLGVTTSQGSYGIYDLDQGVYTVMSYNDGWPLDPDGAQPFTVSGVAFGWSGSLGALDIAALQERYGVHASHTGNDVYTIASDNGPGAFYQTIWDTGGNDTIAYNGSTDAQIDLLAATLDYSPTGGGVISYAQGVHAGFTIANGVVIENATGGSGNDVLLGNSAGNILSGNLGDDSLMGRDGNDSLFGGAGDDTLLGGLGKDDLNGGTGADIFVFQDTSMDKILDFKTGLDKIDLSKFEIDNSAIKIAGSNLFADTDHNGSYDFHLVVQGDTVHMSDILFV